MGNTEIHRPAGRVGAAGSGRRYCLIVFRTTVATGDPQWKAATMSQVIQPVDEARLHLVLAAVRTVKLRQVEVAPAHFIASAVL